MIKAYYIYCAFSSCYSYISSTSDHEALDLGGWGPLYLTLHFHGLNGRAATCPGTNHLECSKPPGRVFPRGSQQATYN